MASFLLLLSLRRVVVTIFTVEYLLRLLVTANKKMFLLNFLNIIDLLSSEMHARNFTCLPAACACTHNLVARTRAGERIRYSYAGVVGRAFCSLADLARAPRQRQVSHSESHFCAELVAL